MGQNGLMYCGTARYAVPTCPTPGTKWDKWDKVGQVGQNGTSGTKWDNLKISGVVFFLTKSGGRGHFTRHIDSEAGRCVGDNSSYVVSILILTCSLTSASSPRG